MKYKIIIMLHSVFFLICIGIELNATNIADSIGFSAEGVARGNAMTASTNEWSSVFYNIAGLGKTRGFPKEPQKQIENDTDGTATTNPAVDREHLPNQFALSAMMMQPRLKLAIFNSSKIPDTIKNKPYGFILLGATFDINNIHKLPPMISSARFGFGLGMNMDGSIAKAVTMDPRKHDFLMYGRQVQRLVLYAGLGIGLFKDVIGFGVGLNFSIAGKARVIPEKHITGIPMIPVGIAELDLNFDPDLVAGIYISPGNRGNILKGLELGASYRMESKWRLFPLAVIASILGSQLPAMMNLAILDFYQPHTITTGVAYTRSIVTVSVDVDYQMWSMFTNMSTKSLQYYNLPDLRDILLYKIGFKFAVLDWLSVMFGYYFQPSILAKSTGGTLNMLLNGSIKWGMYNYLDNDKHVASVGLRFMPIIDSFKGRVNIILSYQFQYLAEKSEKKYSDIATATYVANPPYSYGGMHHALICEIGFRI